MTGSRKKDFINDKRRISYLSSVYTRIYRGQSVLIEGAYGVGKTRFLKLIKPKKLMPVGLESLDNKHEILASILQGLDYESIASHWRTSTHLKKICTLSGFLYVFKRREPLAAGPHLDEISLEYAAFGWIRILLQLAGGSIHAEQALEISYFLLAKTLRTYQLTLLGTWIVLTQDSLAALAVPLRGDH